MIHAPSGNPKEPLTPIVMASFHIVHRIRRVVGKIHVGNPTSTQEVEADLQKLIETSDGQAIYPSSLYAGRVSRVLIGALRERGYGITFVSPDSGNIPRIKVIPLTHKR
jgi:hypothetical protein